MAIQKFVAKPVAAAVLLALLQAGGAGPVNAANPPASVAGIAWQKASSDAEVDKAFALGRESGKPVFLYWGAVWCPPCNQVKATLFSRPDFVERSRAFVPVYVDGDKPGAQKVAARFKVQGYPTMIVFKPDGTEITRLPGEVDAERYLLTLTAGLNAQTPVKDLVRRALAKQPITPEQWRLLAFYSWDTDEQQVLSSTELPQRLAELAANVPAELASVRDRLAFKSLAAFARADSSKQPSAVEAGRQLTNRVLSDPGSATALSDLVIGQAESVVKFLAPEGEPRRALSTKWDAALHKLLESNALSKSDRIDALDSRVALWKMMEESGTVSSQRRAEVLREVARVVAATTDRYERQAVVPGAAHVLSEAGLIKESDELLKFELPRAVAPYYHMLVLASNAVKRNDAKAALTWYEQAWRKSEGPATRIQWGTGYVKRVVELSPGDLSRVESSANAVIGQLSPKGETFYERNQRSLQKMAQTLSRWQGADPARTRVVESIKRKLAATCARVPADDAGRSNCENVFSRANA
jgi:thiol-disulfide isomerase/thioredoxin